MTKEQAIEWLKSLNYCDGEETQEVAQAIDIAIKTLEQQSDDCVSRAEVDKLINLYLRNPTIDDSIAFYEHFLDLPSVTPTQKWIPTSERLPNIKNRTEKYLVTLKYKTVCDAMFTECDGEHWWDYDGIVAWQPLPKPYKEKRGSK